MLAVTDAVRSSCLWTGPTAACAPSTAVCARRSSRSPRSRRSAVSPLNWDSSRPRRKRTNTPTQTSSAQNTAAISAASCSALIPAPHSVSCLLLLGLRGLRLRRGYGRLAEDRPDPVGAFGDPGLQPVPGRLVICAVGHRVRSVALRDDAFVEVVRVPVALAVADLARPRIVRIAQV